MRIDVLVSGRCIIPDIYVPAWPRKFRAMQDVKTLLQSPYSSGLAPADFFFVSKVQDSTQRTPFDSIEVMRVTTALNEDLAKIFEGPYQAWVSREKNV